MFEHPGIERLFVFGPPDEDLIRFGQIATLQRLELSEGRRLRSLRGVERLHNLRHLGLYHQSGLVTLDGLAGATRLTTLEIDGCKKFPSVAEIGELRSVRKLKLADCGPIESLAPLAHLEHLEQFFAWESTDVRMAISPSSRDCQH